MPTQLNAHSRASVKSTCLILPFARLLLAVCCASGSLVAAQSTSRLDNVATRCESVILYEVCGDPRLLRQSTTAIDAPMFDIEQAEELEIAQQLRSLSATPAAPLHGVGEASTTELERRWNEVVRPAITRIRLYGSVTYFNLSEGDFQVGVFRYPSLAVTPLRDLLEGFNPSIHFNDFGRLMFATEPVARIDISSDPATIEVRWPPLQRICKTIVDKPPNLGLDECARTLIQFVAFPFQFPYVVVENEELTANSPSLLEIMTRYYARIWVFSVYVSEFKKHSVEVPRRVFAFSAKVTASPSVDKFGNLYVPENLLNVGPPEAEKLRLIMLHEAAHVELLGADFAQLAAMLFTNEVVQMFADAKDKKTAAQVLPIWFRLFRRTDESLADLLALRDIGSDRNARKRYQGLVEKLETVSVTRNALLKVACEYLDSGGDTGRLLAARAMISQLGQYLMKEPERGRTIVSKYDSTKDWAAATPFVEAELQDLERIQVELAGEIEKIGPGFAPNTPEVQNPWTFERQIQDLWEQLSKQLVQKYLNRPKE